jgi:hypothetical protein
MQQHDAADGAGPHPLALPPAPPSPWTFAPDASSASSLSFSDRAAPAPTPLAPQRLPDGEALPPPPPLLLPDKQLPLEVLLSPVIPSAEVDKLHERLSQLRVALDRYLRWVQALQQQVGRPAALRPPRCLAPRPARLCRGPEAAAAARRAGPRARPGRAPGCSACLAPRPCRAPRQPRHLASRPRPDRTLPRRRTECCTRTCVRRRRCRTACSCRWCSCSTTCSCWAATCRGGCRWRRAPWWRACSRSWRAASRRWWRARARWGLPAGLPGASCCRGGLAAGAPCCSQAAHGPLLPTPALPAPSPAALQVRQLHQQLDQLTTEYSTQLEAEQQERQRLAAEAAQSRLLCSARARQLASLQQELQAAQQAAAGAAGAAGSQAAELQQRAQQLEQRVGDAEGELQRERAQLAALQEARQQREALCERLQRKVAELGREGQELALQNEFLEGLVADLQSSRPDQQAADRYGAELQRLREAAEGERRQLQEELQQERGRAGELEGRLAQLEQQAEQEAARARALELQLQQAQEREAEAACREEALQQQLAALQQQLKQHGGLPLLRESPRTVLSFPSSRASSVQSLPFGQMLQHGLQQQQQQQQQQHVRFSAVSLDSAPGRGQGEAAEELAAAAAELEQRLQEQQQLAGQLQVQLEQAQQAVAQLEAQLGAAGEQLEQQHAALQDAALREARAAQAQAADRALLEAAKAEVLEVGALGRGRRSWPLAQCHGPEHWPCHERPLPPCCCCCTRRPVLRSIPPEPCPAHTRPPARPPARSCRRSTAAWRTPTQRSSSTWCRWRTPRLPCRRPSSRAGAGRRRRPGRQACGRRAWRPAWCSSRRRCSSWRRGSSSCSRSWQGSRCEASCPWVGARGRSGRSLGAAGRQHLWCRVQGPGAGHCWAAGGWLTPALAALLQEQAAQAAGAVQLQEQLQQWRARAGQLQLQLVTQQDSFVQQLEQVGRWARRLPPSWHTPPQATQACNGLRPRPAAPAS